MAGRPLQFPEPFLHQQHPLQEEQGLPGGKGRAHPAGKAGGRFLDQAEIVEDRIGGDREVGGDHDLEEQGIFPVAVVLSEGGPEAIQQGVQIPPDLRRFQAGYQGGVEDKPGQDGEAQFGEFQGLATADTEKLRGGLFGGRCFFAKEMNSRIHRAPAAGS